MCYVCYAVQVQYMAQHLSSLLLAGDTRTDLLRLPYSLLQQLLASEALDVEQVCLHGCAC